MWIAAQRKRGKAAKSRSVAGPRQVVTTIFGRLGLGSGSVPARTELRLSDYADYRLATDNQDELSAGGTGQGRAAASLPKGAKKTTTVPRLVVGQA